MSRREPAAIRHLVVAGLMGAGKTSVGRALAARLRWPVHDSDAALLEGSGWTARDIQTRLGTESLHEAEADDLVAALAGPGPSVICPAASVVENAAARTALGGRGIVVIWLRGSPAVLARRFTSGGHRPIYGADPENVARAQAAIRDPLFASLATITLDVDERTVDELVEQALRGLETISTRRRRR